MNYRSLLTEAFDALRQLDEDVTEDFDKLTITPSKEPSDIWLDFDGLGVKGHAKVFIEGSEYGVPSFRQISKLVYKGVDNCSFDRGWDVKPTDKQLFKNICKQLVDFRKENPYSVNESKKTKKLKEAKEKYLIWSNEVNDDEIVEFAKDYYNANYGDDYEISFEDWLSDNKDTVEEWLFDDNWRVYKNNIKPEIDNQINHNTLFLVGNYNSNYPNFRPSGSGSITEESLDDITSDWDLIELYSNNGNIEVVLKDHDGSVSGTLFTLPTDNESLLVIANSIEDYNDLSDEEKIDELIYDFEYQYRDFRDIDNPELLIPIKDTF